MADTSPSKFWAFWKPILTDILKYALTALVGGLMVYLGFRPAPVVERVEVPVQPDWLGEADKPFVGTDEGRFRPAYGWVKDPQAIQANLDPLQTIHFAHTPAGRAVMGDDDVFMWRILRKVANRGPPWYPNIDQGQVGSCVGAGNKHAADICLGVAIQNGGAFEWKPTSAEVIYAGSRVEVGGGRIRGDGSVGAWAAKWLKNWGVVPMEPIDGIDLSNYSPARAREWGRTGVPASVEALAKQFPVKGIALVTTGADVKRCVQQFYPIAVCSDQGFQMQRDASGTCRAMGTWFHCMCICGYRHHPQTNREQYFILNSWNDNAHGGPRVPDDAPAAGFWADADVVEHMVAQGDSFAFSDIQGFPARKVPVDWWIMAEPKRPAPRNVLFAERSLAW